MASALVDSLEAFGCDTKGALKRLCGDEELYSELLTDYLSGTDFDDLERAVSENNSKAAFEAAHSMKGAFGSLGITPIFQLVSEVTEIFRSGSCENSGALLAEIKNIKSALDGIVAADK